MNLLKTLIGSKRVWIGLVAVVGIILNKSFGYVIDDATMERIVDVILVVIGSFGLTGLGKEATVPKTPTT